MALFDEKKPFSYEIVREGEDTILTIDCEAYFKIPSIEDDPLVMSKTCDLLNEVSSVTKIVFSQKRNYEYDFNQVVLLQGIAKLYAQLTKQKDIFSYNALISDPQCTKCVGSWYAELRHIISDTLRSDPIGA